MYLVLNIFTIIIIIVVIIIVINNGIIFGELNIVLIVITTIPTAGIVQLCKCNV